jgi:hypothetical protein
MLPAVSWKYYFLCCCCSHPVAVARPELSKSSPFRMTQRNFFLKKIKKKKKKKKKNKGGGGVVNYGVVLVRQNKKTYFQEWALQHDCPSHFDSAVTDSEK